jgi:peptide/nickel transport system permease protein
MHVYVIRRLFALIFVLFGVSVLTFTIAHLQPSDPARFVAGDQATDEQVGQIRARLGLDRPLPEQYFRYMTKLLTRGDLGVSMLGRRPVAEALKDYLPASLELALFTLLFAVPLGVALGIISATRAGGVVDFITRLVAIAGVCVPVFFSGLLLQLLFYGILDWFPPGGRISLTMSPPAHITGLYLVDSILTGNSAAFVDSLRHIFLPALTLTLGNLGLITRMTRASILEILLQDYVRTARAKGLAERVVLTRHVLKNAFNPVLTVIGLQLASLIGWMFIVEIVFSWPGIGTYAVRAVMSFDFEPIMGFVLFMCVIYVVVNLVVDLLYPVFDPRIRY